MRATSFVGSTARLAAAAMIAAASGGCFHCNGRNPVEPPMDSTPTPSYLLSGLAFSPYLDGPPGERSVTEAEVRERLQRVAPYTERILVYGTSFGLDLVPPIAKELGLEVYGSAWINANHADNEREIARLVELVRQGHVDVAVVGLEVLLRGDVTEAQLLQYISDVRGQVPGAVPIAYEDVYNVLSEHPAVINAVDQVLANIYPFHEGASIDRAMRGVHCAFDFVKRRAVGKPVLVGETGWPSGGNTKRSAVPDLVNAARYFQEFVSWARSESVEYFYFAAFDEEWKVTAGTGYNAHWGIWDKNLSLKAGMEPVFAGSISSDSWTLEKPVRIEFDEFPAGFEAPFLRGRAEGLCALDHHVAIWIEVQSGWWPKPTFGTHRTGIGSAGFWQASVVNAGIDDRWERIGVFLYPNAHVEPAVIHPVGDLPSSLCDSASAGALITRDPGGAHSVRALCDG